MPAPASARPARTLRRRLGTTFLTLTAVLLVASGIAIFTAVRFTETSNEVIYRWQRAVSFSTRLLADLVNQETGVRGYVLSHQEEFLAPYTDYLAQQHADEARLRTYTAGDPDLQRRLRAVQTAAAAWRTDVAEPAITRTRQADATAETSLQAGRRAFDTVRARSAALTDALVTRARAERGQRTTLGILTLVFSAIALLVVLVSGYLLWRGLHRWVLAPVVRLADQTRHVAAGATHEQIVPSGPGELSALGHDVEAMRRQIAEQLDAATQAQHELELRSAELARSNDDLQQFAYVASHDLSEPLRKVANFCQLLERQYGPQLDERAGQYIYFAVDGAKRMQALIADLLALSRVGRTTEEFETVDLDVKLDQALANLSERITAAGATIERVTPLPTIDGDRALLISLFENLVGNAVKYRRPDVAPVVRVAAERDDATRTWIFTVSDNGIGIAPEYGERIFAVFQRLHVRDQYPGTGIGLSLCRRIVEFHGGRIWLADVQSAQGATFHFTLPESRTSARSHDRLPPRAAQRPAR